MKLSVAFVARKNGFGSIFAHICNHFLQRYQLVTLVVSTLVEDGIRVIVDASDLEKLHFGFHVAGARHAHFVQCQPACSFARIAVLRYDKFSAISFINLAEK